jgi:HEAT repeat protein
VLAAVRELAGIPEPDARQAVIGQLSSASEMIRIEVIRLLGSLPHTSAVTALMGAVETGQRSNVAIEAIIRSLGQLEMCQGIPALIRLLDFDNNSVAAEALKSLGKIGCPEAIPGLLPFLRKAEAAKTREDALGTTGKPATLYKPCLELLTALTGQSHAKAAAWEACYSGQSLRLASVHYCESSRSTFEVPYGQPKKCAHEGERGHNDFFVKHRRESEMVGAPAPKK